MNTRVNYLGSKSGAGVYQAIINLMPPHDTYIEPFLGTGAVLLKKAPAMQSIGIDLNASILKHVEYSIGLHGYAAEVHLLQTDSIKWLTNFKPKNKTVIYCDPPYVLSTRTSDKRYTHEFSDDDHKKLLTVLKGIDAKVLISGYRNSIYDELLSDWFSLDFQAMTRGGVRTETVWCNFQPGEVHYHTFAGKNFTDRQRIKRKAQRWASNYAKLPHQERQAVLAAILGVDPA